MNKIVRLTLVLALLVSGAVSIGQIAQAEAGIRCSLLSCSNTNDTCDEQIGCSCVGGFQGQWECRAVP
jgi:hypothetical protein